MEKTQRLKVPFDDEGYVKAFDIKQTKEILQFFDIYGFVCIKDILSEEECKKSVKDIGNYLESGQWHRYLFQEAKEKFETKVKFDDIKTWDTWPEMSNSGILGKPPVFTAQSLENRQNPKLYDAFRTILKDDDLYVSIDRFGFFRPTNQVPVDNKLVDFPEWKTKLGLHLDVNPWNYFSNKRVVKEEDDEAFAVLETFCREYNDSGIEKDNIIKLQGLVNFIDNRKEDGGFHLVPGYHKKVKEWQKDKKPSKSLYNPIPQSDPMYKEIVRVTLRAGSICIWNNLMPHGSSPNNSDRMRMCQYIKMFPKSHVKVSKQRKKVLMKMMEINNFKPSELGIKLFGLDE